MKEKTFEKVTEYIDAIAAKMGVAAEHVYELMVRQQFAEGVADTIIGVVCLTFFAILAYLLVGAYTKAEYETEKGSYTSFHSPANIYAKIYEMIDDSDGLFYLPYALVQFALLLFGVICTHTGVLAIINPEYYAIKEILDALGGK